MKPEHWDDTRLRKIGKEFAAEAYALADELNSYGADASVYLLPDAKQVKQWKKRGPHVHIPVEFADALMALLLSMPRAGRKPGKRRLWSTEYAQHLLSESKGVNEAARTMSEETGLPFRSMRRRLQELKRHPGAK